MVPRNLDRVVLGYQLGDLVLVVFVPEGVLDGTSCLAAEVVSSGVLSHLIIIFKKTHQF